MHERLRLELLRRIQRGTLSVSLLARQTGFGQAHLSNFLRSRRQLSLEAMDRILAAQQLTVADLLPALPAERILAGRRERRGGPGGFARHGAFRAGDSAFGGAVDAASAARGLAVCARESYECAPGLAAVCRHPGFGGRRPAHGAFGAARGHCADRPALQFAASLPTQPPQFYAVRHGAHLTLRYAEFQSSRLILRPHNIAFPVELIALDPEESPSDLLTGRIALILNEI